MASVPVLRPYQREGIRFLLTRPHAALFWDPGLGKTLATMLAYRLLKDREPTRGLLIVAPLQVAKSVWIQEAAKWEPTAHFRVSLLHGKDKKPLARQPADIHVINYEGLQWLFQEFGPEEVLPWSVICFDELSKCKSVGTRRHKLLKKAWVRFDRHWGLTGTPAPNSMLELWGQLRVLDGGQALGSAFHKYQQRFFYKPNTRDYNYMIKPGAGDIIAQRLNPVAHRLSAADHLKMPDRIDVWHELTLNPSVKKRYDDLERDAYLDLEGSEVTAVSAGVLWSKLQQCTQGFHYATSIETQDQVVERFDTTKLDALEEIIEEASGQPVLVMYKFKADLIALLERFPEAETINSKNAERLVPKWNRKEITVMLANPQSAGHGLNLQAGGHIMVYYTLESSLERYIQANGRLHRQGQEHPVIIHHLLAKGTVDTDIRSVLEKRASIQDALLTRLSVLQQKQPSGDAHAA